MTEKIKYDIKEQQKIENEQKYIIQQLIKIENESSKIYK